MADAVRASPERLTSTHPLLRYGGKENRIDSCCRFRSPLALDPQQSPNCNHAAFSAGNRQPHLPLQPAQALRTLPVASIQTPPGKPRKRTGSGTGCRSPFLPAPRLSPASGIPPTGRIPLIHSQAHTRESPCTRRCDCHFFPAVPNIRTRDLSPCFRHANQTESLVKNPLTSTMQMAPLVPLNDNLVSNPYSSLCHTGNKSPDLCDHEGDDETKCKRQKRRQPGPFETSGFLVNCVNRRTAGVMNETE